MTVDIIIPNFNGEHLIEKNLPNVLAAIEKFDGRIIIVDDGSEEADKEKLREVIKKYKVELYEHKTNLGFSSAVNSGVSKSDATYVVLLNSDVVPRINFLDSLLLKMENDQSLFSVGCLDESIEGEQIIKRGRGVAHWSKGMLVHSKGEVGRDDTFWTSGGSSIYRRSIYEKLGGMDTLYNPFYWEDIDISYRAQKAGFKVLFDKNSVVTHMHDKGAIKTYFKQSSITAIAYRNQFIFIWKNITSKRLILSHILYLPIYILKAIKHYDKNFLKGLFLAVLKLPVIIDKRQKQKKLYKVSDAEIIGKIS